jgi:Zn-dependent peptidase ImmA (M78 family)
MNIHPSIVATAVNGAADVTYQFGFGDLPVPIENVARLLGVTQIVTRQMQASGLLTCAPDGITIYTKAGDPQYRRRFTVAHELGHLLLARAAGEEVRQFHRGRSRYTNEERAADRLGAELLMPAHLVEGALRGYCRESRTSFWAFLESIQRRFQVSLSSMALRTLEVGGVTAILIRARSAHAELPTSCVVDCSKEVDVRFLEPPLAITHRLLQRSCRTLRLVVEGIATDMAVDYLKRPLATQSDGVDEHWFIGWRETMANRCGASSPCIREPVKPRETRKTLTK